MNTDKMGNVVPFQVEDILHETRPEEFILRGVDPERFRTQAELSRAFAENMGRVADSQTHGLAESMTAAFERWNEKASVLWRDMSSSDAVQAFGEYAVDHLQRQILFTDILRRRGNNFIRHEREGCPPVLAYDYEIVVDGRKLSHPVNYSLVRIIPPSGIEVRDDARPYVIIDPRAGHGSGIGGFKHESEVGVAVRAGHPVYFTIFSPHPEPGQTLAHVCRAEAEFLRTVRRLHPDSPKPVVVGNCQGGWAAMLLAAAHPGLTGPVVINGSPLSYWSGIRGKHPMRYLGGLMGGILPALILADLGNGEFDGANLVLNFESLNPGNSWVKKYYEVFAKGDEEAEHYLEFERWWSGFFFLTDAEILWIVENLFVGNRLARGGAYLDSRTHVDLRNVRAPVIVFASHGDNITPVPQALNWIADIYSSVQEIKARGQRIVYTVHDSVGHLGIFVSSKVANKEHEQIVTALKTIEAMPPGLYEMVIHDISGEKHEARYEISFEEREIGDVLALDDQRDDEIPFAAVARLSEFAAELYSIVLRPFVRASVSAASAKAMFAAHPLRLRRALVSDQNPLVAPVAALAEQVRRDRRPVSPDNPFLGWERYWAEVMQDGFDLFRDWRDGMMEIAFFGLYGSPVMSAFGAMLSGRISDVAGDDLRVVPEVRHALEMIDQGSYADALVRMLILLAHSRHGVNRNSLERSNEVLSGREPFASMEPAARSRIIHRQTLIVEFEPEGALASLPLLLADPEERAEAFENCRYVLGSRDELSAGTADMLERIAEVLDLSAAKAEGPAPARKPGRSRPAKPA